MKKLSVLLVLLSLMTISAKAQWFDFSVNNDRAVASINTGLVGYRSVGAMGTDNLADIGVGMGLAVAGIYVDFEYVTPDHRFDSHIVNYDWEDHDAFVLNLGYQIPIYGDYVFVTPMIGWSRVSTGFTEGNNIGLDTETRSIYHKYYSTWHDNYFNYGGMLTVVPCKWFEINAAFTSHAVYGGIAFNLAKD